MSPMWIGLLAVLGAYVLGAALGWALWRIFFAPLYRTRRPR